MNAEDLLELINTYNSREEDIFDDCADLFISKVLQELKKMYTRGDWARMVSITQLGISLITLSENFKEFEFNIYGGYPMRFGEDIHKNYGLPTFQNFIESEKYKDFELSGFQNEDILQIVPFYKSLKRKGFECYIDTDSNELVVALNIK